jgi:hypothetical protein
MKYIIVHHTGGTDSDPLFDTSNQTFEVVNQYHKQKWGMRSVLGSYLGYNYFIDKQGKTTCARLDGEEGAHTIGYNKEIGICLAGNFDVTLPTQKQVESLTKLLSNLISTHGSLEIVPHRKFARKTCYGTKLADNWASSLVYNEIVLTGILQRLIAYLKTLKPLQK